jgi:hypothetical protein
MLRAKAHRKQIVELTTNDVIGQISEDRLGAMIEMDNSLREIDRDDGVCRDA